MNNAPRDEREVGAPVKTVEHIDDRQAMNGGLSVRAQFDGARSTPAFVHADVRQSTRGQLPDRRAAIDVIDRLQVDVEGEIKVPRQVVETVRPLLRRMVPVSTSIPFRLTRPTVRSPRISRTGSPSFFGWP